MFCENCGKQINENAKFCTNCGKEISSPNGEVSGSSDYTTNPLLDEYENGDLNNDKKNNILKKIRGIPFLLLFLTFFLPLVVVSCPVINKEIADFSVYQSADLVQSASDVLASLNDVSYDEDTVVKIEEIRKDASTVKVFVFFLLAFTGLAFFFSFSHRKLAAVLGILGVINLLILTFALCGMSKNQDLLGISPSVGFYFSCLLFVSGIVMNFISASNANGGVKKRMNVMAVLYVLTLLAVFIIPPLYLSLTTVNVGSQTWKKKDECKGSECLYVWSEAQKACPKGFHIPRLDEWQKLFAYANSSTENKAFVQRMLDEKVIDEFYKTYNVDISEAHFDTQFSWGECYQYREDSPGTEFWTASEQGEYAVVIASVETSTFLYCDKKINLGKNKVRCVKD